MRILAVALLICCSACTVISYNRVFPKLAWYWSAEAVDQRRERKAEKHDESLKQGATNNFSEMTPLAIKIQKRDGTNFLGVYMGMIAEWDGSTSVWDGKKMVPGMKPQGVMMFSATSGEWLKWISYEDFRDIFVLKTKPEYPKP